MPMHYVVKKEIGKKKRILQPLLPNLFFVYTTREAANAIIKKKGDEPSILKFYLDKTKPLEENGKHPPLTIPFAAMINFIKATSTDSEHVRIVAPEQCHYKSGDLVKVIGGEFEGVTGKVPVLQDNNVWLWRLLDCVWWLQLIYQQILSKS